MATRQQGVFRHHARAEVIAGEWDAHLLQVGRGVGRGGGGRVVGYALNLAWYSQG